jgi:clan AA aspartic protease
LILGVVTADGREAIIEVSVRGPAARERIVTAVIDTGFDGWLTLPSALAADLGLVRVGWQRAVLADGNEVQLDVFEATVVWGWGARTCARGYCRRWSAGWDDVTERLRAERPGHRGWQRAHHGYPERAGMSAKTSSNSRSRKVAACEH